MWNHFDNGFLSRKHDICVIKKCDKLVRGNNKFIIESQSPEPAVGHWRQTWRPQTVDWLAKMLSALHRGYSTPTTLSSPIIIII